MALMIPSHPHEKTPPGEKEVFQRLRDDSDTSDWVVLHSLDISSHIKNVTGEADFLVLVPSHGVLCIEVKSHFRIKRTTSGWYFGNNPNCETRGPFTQASEAMHSLRKYLIERSPDHGNLIFSSAACFPYAPLNVSTDEWEDWQCIDKAKFKRAPLSKTIISILRNAREKMKDKGHTWVDEAVMNYTKEKMDAVAQIFRPCFEVIPPGHSNISVLESEIKSYTEEQFRALDLLTNNSRLIFSGPAGTGKTFISIEAAIRAKKENANAKIVWVCFNKNLARWINQKSDLKKLGIKAIHLHNWMLETSGEKPTQQQYKNSEYWDSELPMLTLNKLLERDIVNDQKVDMLIVDEAQDILHEDLLDFLDFMLKGGLSTGKWMFFGDFSLQTIYKSINNFELQTLGGRCHAVPQCSLNTNCRNRPRTAYRASTLARMEPYKKVLRSDDEKEPSFLYYETAESQLELILETLDTLKKEGYRNEDIVLLSPVKSSLAAKKLAKHSNWKSVLLNEATPSPGKLRYSTIHGFKGMEAPIILLTDIEHIASKNDEMLLYIGLTRSTDRVHAFINKKAQTDLIKLLVNQS